MKNKKLGLLEVKFKSVLGYTIWFLIVLLLISTVRNIGRVINIRKQVEVERQKVEKMQADNVKLQVQIAEAQGQDFIEKQIRRKREMNDLDILNKKADKLNKEAEDVLSYQMDL